MLNEIERKFIINNLPKLNLENKLIYKRYFIYSNEGVEIRIQQKGNQFELERKEKVTNLVSKKDKIIISNGEFEFFKSIVIKEIIRDGYIIYENDVKIDLKVYHGNFEGLIRAEVEFATEEEAQNFLIPKWFDKEITDSPLGRDSKLVDLSINEFNKILGNLFDS